jgi:hypothetical protein
VAFSLLLWLIFFVVGLVFFGPRSASPAVVVPALPALVPPAPGAVVSCDRGCSGCLVAAGCPSLPAPLAESGCSVLVAASGRRLSGAALSVRVRSLVLSGVFVVA